MFHAFLNLLTNILIILIIREGIFMIFRTVLLHQEIRRLQGKIALVYALLSTKELFNTLGNLKTIPVRGSGLYEVSLTEECLRIDETEINLNLDLINQLLPLVTEVIEKIEEKSFHGIFLKRNLIYSCQAIENLIRELPCMIEIEKKKGQML